MRIPRRLGALGWCWDRHRGAELWAREGSVPGEGNPTFPSAQSSWENVGAAAKLELWMEATVFPG